MSTSFGWKGKGRYGLFRLPCHPFSENPGYVQRGLTIMVVCHVGTRSYYSLKPRSRYVLREHVDFYGSVHTHCVVVRRRTQHVAQSELVRRRTAKQLCQWQQQWIIRFSICRVLRRRTANSAFHPSGVGKWVPTSAGKVKAGMVHSVSGWRRGVQVKLWDPLWTRAIPERLWGVITTRRYTNPRLLTLPYVAVRRRTLTHGDVRPRTSMYGDVHSVNGALLVHLFIIMTASLFSHCKAPQSLLFVSKLTEENVGYFVYYQVPLWTYPYSYIYLKRCTQILQKCD